MKTIELTDLECKALWIGTTAADFSGIGSVMHDPAMRAAFERALDRVWRAHRGMEPREAA